MMRLRKWMTVLSCVTLLLFLPGCWDYQKIDMRASLIGLAVDPAPDDSQKLHLTLQFPVMSATGQGGGGGSMSGAEASSTRVYQNVESEGKTLSGILKDIQLQMDRNIDLSDMRCIILSDELSGQQLKDITEDLIRDPAADKLAYMAVARGEAKGILESNPPTGAPSDVLGKKFSTDQQQRGYSMTRRLWEFWRDGTRIGVSPILPIVNVVDAGGSTGNTESSKQLETGGAIAYDTKTCKKAWVLSKEDVLILNMIQGKVRNMGAEVPSKNGTFALNELRSTAKLQSISLGSKLVLKVKVHIIAGLGRRPGGDPASITPTNENEMQNETAAYFEQKITETLRKSQETGSDVLGFVGLYVQKHPKQENNIKANWSDIYKEAMPEVSVDVQIRTKGTLI